MVQNELDARFGENFGIDYFNNTDDYRDMHWRTFKYTISDHRPVWVEFGIGLGDDD